MGRLMQPARIPGAGTAAPDTISGKYKTGETFLKGAVLQLDANGELVEYTADAVTGLAGIAMEAVASKPGYQAANNPAVITGQVQEVSYAKANRQTVFTGRGENATVHQSPAQTNIGEKYGVIKSGNDYVVDFSDVVNVVVQIVDIEPDSATGRPDGYFFFKFLESTLAVP